MIFCYNSTIDWVFIFEETNKKVCQQISLIGDQYIRRKFEKEYQYYKDIYDLEHPDMRALDEEIAAKEQELKAIKRRREELGGQHAEN